MVNEVGGIIAAASRAAACPLQQTGSIPAVKRIVLTFQQAGIFPIVVVTGVEADEVRYQLSDFGVIFVHNDDCVAPELIDSFKLGLSYLGRKCRRVVLTPVNVPMFLPRTLISLLACDAEIVTPICDGQDGHPVVLSHAIVDAIFQYEGACGLRSAIEHFETRRKKVETTDRGTIHTVHDTAEMEAFLERHNADLLHPFLRVSIEKDVAFFNARAKLLLLLIDETNSVRSASEQMALSYSKAWEMLNKLESELGYPVVDRRHGGSRGGKTSLTERGAAFLKAYQTFEENLFRYAREQFDALFREGGAV
ncbi:NTP transferase domain-containing protein [Synergistaceae bacterium OttesenSCG-928-I11]|nr:NTP transferase domain-containing protein [Synergistaceae bacterium OttesenSCG-928-I11]